MINRNIGLLLLGTTAVCVAGCVPSRVGDARLPKWMNLLEDAKSAATHLRAALHFDKPATPGPTVAGPIGTAPSLEPPKDTPNAAAQKQALAVAAANERLKALKIDPTGVEEAIVAYRADNLAAGDAAAQKVADPLARTALEWVAIREVAPRIGLERLHTFMAAHPQWPSQGWFQHLVEARLLQVKDARTVETYLSKTPPVTALGRYALAKAYLADGRVADAISIARELFREGELPGSFEARFKSEFGAQLSKADYKYRADKLVYGNQIASALRYAAEAGPDIVALEKARVALVAEGNGAADKALAAVPEGLKKDPGLILAQAQKLRHADKLLEAANLLQSAPKDVGALIDGDEWWTERRVLARRLLDDGKINSAYVLCATPAAQSREDKIDAQFHAGWIALRFMNDPPRAAYHFFMAAKLAETPTSLARIAYWQGRTAENSTDPDAPAKATAFYRKAADYPSTYYGQLARQTLGLSSDPVHVPSSIAVGDERDEAIRVVELLYAADEKEAALALALEVAKSTRDERQAGALAAVITAQHDAHLALTIGKILSQRGIALDELAFPTFGIPPYEALQNSAPAPVVYSIARQESAFLPQVVSKAGAKGLMQMIDATARHTAVKAGLAFDGQRMLTDAAFNAQLGAAHLGELLSEQGGSYILTFAAYNAGGGRVKQWIDAYGDPRTPGVDPIDWVERIPFTETRNYVQRVMANMGMYQAIFADRAKVSLGAKPEREAKL